MVLEGLEDGDLGGEGVGVVFDGETDDFVDGEFEGGEFHVGFGFGEVVGGAG